MGSAKVLLVGIVLCLVLCVHSQADPRRQSSKDFDAQQCQLHSITKMQPSQQIQSEGGLTEIWDPQDEQFQCVGVAAMRVTVQSNSLSLPKYFPAPRMIYVVRGRGLFGISYPGCEESYYTREESRGQAGRSQDSHQKVERIKEGDVIAVPTGAAHWSYNDGSEDLVFVSVVDISNQNNQLDQNFRAFMLAGGKGSPQRSEGQKGSPQDTFQNVFAPLDEQLMAEALKVPRDLVRRMQRQSGRGLIVKCDKDMSMIKPDEEQEQQRPFGNVLEQEEDICNMKFRHNLNTQKKADVYNRQAGKINTVNQLKLPILRYIQMNAEKGYLLPNAIYTPHWSQSDHRVIYAIRGELQVQISDDLGNTVMNEVVRHGDMFIVPQFFTTVSRAGKEGFEWISLKTSGTSRKNPMAGYVSVMRAMPNDVLRSAYRITAAEAERVKMNRDPETFLMSPTRRSSLRENLLMLSSKMV